MKDSSIRIITDEDVSRGEKIFSRYKGARAAVEKCGGSLRAVEPRGGRGACLRMEFPVFSNAEAQRRGGGELFSDKEKTVP